MVEATNNSKSNGDIAKSGTAPSRQSSQRSAAKSAQEESKGVSSEVVAL